MLSGGVTRISAQTALPSACPAVDNLVPFYFDPSVTGANQIVINDPVCKLIHD